MRTKISLLVFTFTAIAACASTTPGAKPHDMSAAQHDSMAAKEENAAQMHGAMYNADAGTTIERCGRGGGHEGGACWSSTSNPTAEHLDEAKTHQKMAADHRAASQALRDAEARACVGLSDADRDMSPFAHRADIASAEALTVSVGSAKAPSSKTVGAVVTFRAVPGMTAQWLQRVLDCHMARNASLGHQVPEMAYCPLVPKGVSAKVTATDTGFAVAMRSDDGATAAEILARAKALVAR